MNTAALQVEYRDCSAGWIYIDISSQGQTVCIHASNVFDPFPALIAWLESIVTGHEVSEFVVDEEGHLVVFRFSCVTREQGVFTLTDPLDDKLLLQSSIPPKKLVGEFYTKLRAFSASPAYRKEEWEGETLAERFSTLLAGITEKVLIDQLLEYPARAIQHLFWKVAPGYEIVYPKSIGPQESMQRFYDYVTNDERPLNAAIQLPYLYPFPQGFDEMPDYERRRYLQECLMDHVSSSCGVKLGELRSSVTEEWLQNEEGENDNPT